MDRRRAIIEIDAQQFVDMFKHGNHAFKVEGGAIPDDARVVGARYDVLRDCWEICLESEAFPVVAEWSMPPTLGIRLRPSVTVSVGDYPVAALVPSWETLALQGAFDG